MSVAVFALQLNQGLTVSRMFYFQSAGFPLAEYIIILGRQLLQQFYGLFHQPLFMEVHALGIEQGHNRIDNNQIAAEP